MSGAVIHNESDILLMIVFLKHNKLKKQWFYMLENVTIFCTQLYTPTLYSQSANTDIHTPSPQRTEIRYAMSTRLYTP